MLWISNEGFSIVGGHQLVGEKYFRWWECYTNLSKFLGNWVRISLWCGTEDSESKTWTNKLSIEDPTGAKWKLHWWVNEIIKQNWSSVEATELVFIAKMQIKMS